MVDCRLKLKIGVVCYVFARNLLKILSVLLFCFMNVLVIIYQFQNFFIWVCYCSNRCLCQKLTVTWKASIKLFFVKYCLSWNSLAVIRLHEIWHLCHMFQSTIWIITPDVIVASRTEIRHQLIFKSTKCKRIISIVTAEESTLKKKNAWNSKHFGNLVIGK